MTNLRVKINCYIAQEAPFFLKGTNVVTLTKWHQVKPGLIQTFHMCTCRNILETCHCQSGGTQVMRK